MLPWIVFVICFALLLGIGIERLIARLGVQPEDPESARSGLALLAERIERWAERRR